MAANVNTVEEVQEEDTFAKVLATLAGIKHRVYADQSVSGF
jgi:hypothetical protein